MKRDAKDHPKNRLMDHYIRGASTYSTMVKVEHFDNDAPTTDFEPCVVYSMNKKKRWEIDEELVSGDEDVNSIIINREVSTFRNAWWSLRYDDFSHCYYNSKPVSSTQIDEAKKVEKVVGYHIVRIPKNYKKVFDKKCIRDIGWRSLEIRGCFTKEFLTPIEYELKENEGPEDFEEEEETPEGVEQPIEKPTGFYNFADHIVAKKQRKPKGWISV